MSDTTAFHDPIPLIAEARKILPEAFDSEGRLLSPIGTSWKAPSDWMLATSPIDDSELAYLPKMNESEATKAVEITAAEAVSWGTLSLDSRIETVVRAANLLRTNRSILAGILAWEIGKIESTAYNDVDRCISGIEWYVENIERMMEGRTPLGLVSNIASWNYPFSVLVLNVVVQALAGNAVIAKIPTQGGGISLTIACGLLRQAGIPATLVGGRGKELTEPLVGHKDIAGLAFVGGRTNGNAVGARLHSTNKQYALEMEGINSYVISNFSNWEDLGKQIRAGFDFGKQRCTAYTRWVVERSLVPKFIETYIAAVSGISVGHPYLGEKVDFGPLISKEKAQELRARIKEAKSLGATVIYEGKLNDKAFADGQDRSAYLAPTLLMGSKNMSDLYLREPFGPVDLLIAVDSEDELIAEANVSGGALVASVAFDDEVEAERIGKQLLAFKVGINKLRSRGDKDEAFGGIGDSWEGAFVGGANFVNAFTSGSERPQGNWPD
jgi:acyl-CoA reductase-like NAD-dependent aldehyde dehydrogenase